MSNLIGQSLGRYHILEQLGEGGMATVYKAHDTQLERNVAIKVILPAAFSEDGLKRARERFMREAKVLAGFNHENIVDVLDYGEQDGIQYIVMKYIPGGTLKQLLEKRSKLLPWKDAISLLIPIARALDYAHQHDIIHRDIKPSNILITEDGKPMLSDFGIAKILETDFVSDHSMDESTDHGTWAQDTNKTNDARYGGMANLTGSRAGIGTPSYMSPEQGLGRTIDRRTDIYSLGIVLYEMVTGRTPFRASTPEAIIDKHVREEPPRPKQFSAQLPGKVERILLRALEKNPSDRYQGADEFAQAMEMLNRMNSLFPALSLVVGGIAFILVILVGFWYSQKASISTKSPSQEIPIILATDMPPLTPTPTSSPTNTPITPTPTLGIGTTMTGKDDMTLLYIPEGKFLMGGEDSLNQARPAHTVYLDAFWIDKTEVTNAMFALFASQSGYVGELERQNITYVYLYGDEWPELPGAGWRNPFGRGTTINGRENYPVIQVTWNDAVAYCEWAGRRLPTEAEWEKAARGSNGNLYPWGNTPPSEKMANYENRIGDIVPVGSYPSNASPYGALDMAGNVYEWVADFFSLTYYANSPYSNPTGPANETTKAVRGGSWQWEASALLTFERVSSPPTIGNSNLGFRCALSANP